jgi:hypothetical protein
MQPTLTTSRTQQPSQGAELNELSMPPVGARSAALDLNTSTLREIATGTSAEEMSYFKFQVERHQASVNLDSVETYAQGSMPSPHQLLAQAA